MSRAPAHPRRGGPGLPSWPARRGTPGRPTQRFGDAAAWSQRVGPGAGRDRRRGGESVEVMRAAPRLSATSDWLDWRVDDCHGRRVGSLAGVYEDEHGTPAWFLVRLGTFSSRYVFVPPADVLAIAGRLSLPYRRETIERAPVLFAPPAETPPAIEPRLRRHFRLGADGPRAVRVRARRSLA